MTSEENKRIVTEGLERRKAEREARLDSYEQDQLEAVHRNCEDARINREAEQSRQLKYQQRIARRQEWAAQAARAQQLEDKATYLDEIKSAQVKWNLDEDADDAMIRFLPVMQTDITTV